MIAHGNEATYEGGGIVAVDISDLDNVQTYHISPAGRFVYDVPAFVSLNEMVVHRFNMGIKIFTL